MTEQTLYLCDGYKSAKIGVQGKTIVEACFSNGGDCPNGQTEMVSQGAAAHYENTCQGWDHGTHVAGIATGNKGAFFGVAKDSNIIAIQIFSRFSAGECGGTPCVMSWGSDQLKGLEYVYLLRGTYSIASVNMSLGGGQYSAYCDNDSRKPAIDNLRAVNIATVIATGNNGYCGYVSKPSCISSAVAVGATDKTDVEAYYNNWSVALQDLFAPGSYIRSSTGDSDNSYENWNGTSMATPHVAGAWSLIRQARPSDSVSVILAALNDTGTQVVTLCAGNDSKPRINVGEAILSLIYTESPPTVTTTAVSNITHTTAISGGNVTSDGGAEVTARGVCWSASANPTTADTHTVDGTGTGGFPSIISGLNPNTTYHVRAYATNNQGTGYGSDLAFTTGSPCLECSGDTVVLKDVTFPAGSTCECTATKSITIGTGVIIKSGATILFKAPQVKVESGARFENGAGVRIKKQ